ncbi:MAG TPA: ABC transporter ATP-binding protein, partial [Terriglobales bacterium]|nr:ABC transporter ATP-binding protein [Terriglobales bacterium]
EPTNDLDVATLGALETMLLEHQGTALVVTHDRYFLDRIATSILAFEGDAKVVRYHGSYSSYLEQRRVRPADTIKPAAPAPAPAAAPRARAAKLSYGEQREREGLPDRIEALEQQIATLERELADPSLYTTRHHQAPQLLADLEQAKAELDKLLQRWEELEEKHEATKGV